MNRNALYMACLLSFGVINSAQAGFTVTSLSLRNTTIDSSGPSIILDSDRIDEILNPLQQVSLAQIGDNNAMSIYDYTWLEEFGLADFNSTMQHQMRNSARISTSTRHQIFIETDEDLVVSLSGSILYNHTPGDETQFLFGMSVREILNNELLFGQTFEGGNADLLPASGMLTVSGEVIISAGGYYRLQTALSADNFDLTTPGIYDASGFANISIRPVPEPTTAVLLLCGANLARRRRR